MKLSLSSVAAGALFITGMAMSPASAVTFDFESAGGYGLFNGAALTTAQAQSPTHSVQLNDPVNNSLIRVIPSDNALNLKLGATSESFSAFIPTGSNNNVAPYGIFGVDVNNDGIWDSTLTTDALVIAFIPGPYATDTWFTTGLDASTNVHVVGNRAGLGVNDFSSSSGGGLLSALDATSTGSGLWGDLNLLRVYVEIGSWPGVNTYNSYVDNLTVSEVPEPLTLSLFGVGFAGMAALRRRKKVQKA